MFHIIITHYLIILFLHHMRVSHQAGRDIWLLLSDFPAHTSHHQTRERVRVCIKKLSKAIKVDFICVREWRAVFSSSSCRGSTEVEWFWEGFGKIYYARIRLPLLYFQSFSYAKHHYHTLDKNKHWKNMHTRVFVLKNIFLFIIAQKSFTRTYIFLKLQLLWNMFKRVWLVG